MSSSLDKFSDKICAQRKADSDPFSLIPAKIARDNTAMLDRFPS